MSACDDKKHKTEIEIMWTNQHGTGPKTDDMLETQVIIQYMCQPYPRGKMTADDVASEFEYHTIRNGQETGIQTHQEQAREADQVSKSAGLHEPYNYFTAYCGRERNKGEAANVIYLSPDIPYPSLPRNTWRHVLLRKQCFWQDKLVYDFHYHSTVLTCVFRLSFHNFGCRVLRLSLCLR